MSFLVFAILSTMKRNLVAFLLLSFGRVVTVNGMWLFLTVSWWYFLWIVFILCLSLLYYFVSVMQPFGHLLGKG